MMSMVLSRHCHLTCAIKEEIKAAELQLIAKLKLSLKNYADKHAGKNFPSINLDTYGLGIFFDPSKPLLRLPSDGWDGVKDKEYSFIAPSSYIYIKIIPSSSLNLKKAEINKALYDGNFQVFPLLSKPDRSPDVNKYGSIISKFKGDGSQEISDFVQVLDNGSIITISTSYLFFSDNRLHLIDIKNGLEKFLTSAVSVMKSLTDDQMDIEIEIGVINGSDLTMSLPNPSGGRYYPNPVKGPLEKDSYVVKRRYNLKNTDKRNLVVRDFILLLINDIGMDFDYDDHIWN